MCTGIRNQYKKLQGGKNRQRLEEFLRSPFSPPSTKKRKIKPETMSSELACPPKRAYFDVFHDDVNKLVVKDMQICEKETKRKVSGKESS